MELNENIIDPLRRFYRKPTASFPPVGNKSRSGAGELRIPLNKDHLTGELQIALELQQSFATAPTAMANLARMVSAIRVQSDKGDLCNLSGEALRAITSFIEFQASDRITLGTATVARQYFSIHFENDEADQGLLTALETSDFSTLDLVLTVADPSAASIACYTGGSTPGTPQFNAVVNANVFPALTGRGKVPGDPYEGVGTALHRVHEQVVPGSTTGAQQPIRLQSAGAVLRMISLIAYDETGAAHAVSDNIIDTIRLKVGTDELINITFADLQAWNEERRRKVLLGSGQAVIDGNDTEMSFYNLQDKREALLYVSIAAGAPASWSVSVTEDYSTEE